MKKTVLISVFILAVLSIGLRDQYVSDDDPNMDQTPKSMLDNQPVAPGIPVDGITDDDGYDNFYLGVTFAEPHITMNPRNPLQSFTAFNTNTGFSSQNGYEWTGNNPNFGVPLAGDPVTAYDSLGNLYYDNMRTVGG